MKMTEGMLSWENESRHILLIVHLSVNIKKKCLSKTVCTVCCLCSLQSSREDEIITSAFRWANNTLTVFHDAGGGGGGGSKVSLQAKKTIQTHMAYTESTQ